MILVDTPVWVDHLRRTNEILEALLLRDAVATHPFIVGEVALGGAARVVIDRLRKLPETVVARDDEVLGLIERYKLIGRRLGYLDVHLLASALLTGTTEVWTFDKSMKAVASDLGIAANLVN